MLFFFLFFMLCFTASLSFSFLFFSFLFIIKENLSFFSYTFFFFGSVLFSLLNLQPPSSVQPIEIAVPRFGSSGSGKKAEQKLSGYYLVRNFIEAVRPNLADQYWTRQIAPAWPESEVFDFVRKVYSFISTTFERMYLHIQRFHPLSRKQALPSLSPQPSSHNINGVAFHESSCYPFDSFNHQRSNPILAAYYFKHFLLQFKVDGTGECLPISLALWLELVKGRNESEFFLKKSQTSYEILQNLRSKLAMTLGRVIAKSSLNRTELETNIMQHYELLKDDFLMKLELGKDAGSQHCENVSDDLDDTVINNYVVGSISGSSWDDAFPHNNVLTPDRQGSELMLSLFQLEFKVQKVMIFHATTTVPYKALNVETHTHVFNGSCILTPLYLVYDISRRHSGRHYDLGLPRQWLLPDETSRRSFKEVERPKEVSFASQSNGSNEVSTIKTAGKIGGSYLTLVACFVII